MDVLEVTANFSTGPVWGSAYLWNLMNLGSPLEQMQGYWLDQLGTFHAIGKFAPISNIEWKMVPNQKKEEMLKAIEVWIS